MFSLEYIILFGVLIVLLLLLIYKKVEGNLVEGMSSITQDTEDVLYYDELTKEDIDGDMFKIQYQIGGLKGLTKQKIQDLSGNVDMAVKTITSIIPRSRKFFQELAAGDKRIPYTLKVKTKDNRSDVPLRRMVKDIYIKIVLADNIDSNTKVIVYRKKNIAAADGRNDSEGMYIFPTLSEIRLNKQQITDNNNNYNVILQEMIRALGFGSLWSVPEYNANVTNYSRMWIQNITSNNPLYIGPKIKKYGNLSATAYYYNKFINRQPNTFTSVPISGSNTKNRWNFQTESSKVNGEQYTPLLGELMSNGAKLSSVTIGALEDLGYLVNYQKADVQNYNELSGGAAPGVGGAEVIQNVEIKGVSGVNIVQDKPGTISNVSITETKPSPPSPKESSSSTKPPIVVIPPPVVVPPVVIVEDQAPSQPNPTPPSSPSKYSWYAVFIDKRFLIGCGVVCGVMILFLVITTLYFNSKANQYQ